MITVAGMLHERTLEHQIISSYYIDSYHISFAIRESRMYLTANSIKKDWIMKPQDILVLLKICVMPEDKWSIFDLSKSIYMSASEVHAAINRLETADLLFARKPKFASVEEFVVHLCRRLNHFAIHSASLLKAFQLIWKMATKTKEECRESLTF